MLKRFFQLNKKSLPFWDEYSERIKTNYYKSPSVYKTHWINRAELLIDMFEKREAKNDHIYDVAEYGCGPYAPISVICEDKVNYKVTKFDIKKWDINTKVLDLNEKNIEFPKINISIFSGVLEYLNDVEEVLSACIENCDYILLSYAFLPSGYKKFRFLNDYISRLSIIISLF